jgi:predicted alpha/beta hydrolase
VEAAAVVAEDGAESVGLDGADPDLPAVLVACVRAGATVRVDGVSGGAQVLGLLAGTAAALEGRAATQVGALMTTTDSEPARAVLADASPAAVRRRLLSVRTDDPDRLLAELRVLGLAED